MKASSLSGEWASCRVTVSCAVAGVDMFVTVLRCQIALPAWLAPVDRDTWPATVCPKLLSPRKKSCDWRERLRAWCRSEATKDTTAAWEGYRGGPDAGPAALDGFRGDDRQQKVLQS